MKFKVNGTFTEKGKQQSFSKEVEATSESRALETVLSGIGSSHNIKRRNVLVHQVEKSKSEGKA